jgi:hypothetical protein
MISSESPEEMAKRAETGDPSKARSAYTAAGVFLLGTVGDVGDEGSPLFGSATAVWVELLSDFLLDLLSDLLIQLLAFREYYLEMRYLHDGTSIRVMY